MSTSYTHITNAELAAAILATQTQLKPDYISARAFGVTVGESVDIALIDRLHKHHDALLNEQARRASAGSVDAACADLSTPPPPRSDPREMPMPTVKAPPDPNITLRKAHADIERAISLIQSLGKPYGNFEVETIGDLSKALLKIKARLGGDLS